MACVTRLDFTASSAARVVLLFCNFTAFFDAVESVCKADQFHKLRFCFRACVFTIQPRADKVVGDLD